MRTSRVGSVRSGTGTRQALDGTLPGGWGDETKPLIDLAGPEGIEPPTRGLGELPNEYP